MLLISLAIKIFVPTQRSASHMCHCCGPETRTNDTSHKNTHTYAKWLSSCSGRQKWRHRGREREKNHLFRVGEPNGIDSIVTICISANNEKSTIIPQNGSPIGCVLCELIIVQSHHCDSNRLLLVLLVFFFSVISISIDNENKKSD